MDEHDDRWYEWLVIPLALVVGLVAAIVIVAFETAKFLPLACRLARRKMRIRRAAAQRRTV